jgi:hypothetical protein
MIIPPPKNVPSLRTKYSHPFHPFSLPSTFDRTSLGPRGAGMAAAKLHWAVSDAALDACKYPTSLLLDLPCASYWPRMNFCNCPRIILLGRVVILVLISERFPY